MKAYCGADGSIHFGRTVPEGMCCIAEAPAKKLRAVISATARLAYDNKTLLVPGVPEAASQQRGMTALIAYCKWIRPRFDGGRT